MTDEMKEARFALLCEYGFGEPPICDLMAVFGCPTLALNTTMMVQGDHADDCAYIYYASLEVECEQLDGLFYAPSLLEHLYFEGRESGWNFDAMLEELNSAISADARLVFVRGCPVIYTEIYEASWAQRDLRFEISDMLKIVGALDYLLSRELRRIQAE